MMLCNRSKPKRAIDITIKTSFFICCLRFWKEYSKLVFSTIEKQLPDNVRCNRKANSWVVCGGLAKCTGVHDGTEKHVVEKADWQAKLLQNCLSYCSVTEGLWVTLNFQNKVDYPANKHLFQTHIMDRKKAGHGVNFAGEKSSLWDSLIGTQEWTVG